MGLRGGEVHPLYGIVDDPANCKTAIVFLYPPLSVRMKHSFGIFNQDGVA